ncbi:HAD family hydrolase [Bifidobacterium felsineum]|uniref:Haloacid dehalogenase n=1 Tax=Bifidobacterium felsineum TaxID=2045440 RepID=A0A2M9HIJ3_9BIFI|nr:HAD family phosphatase [Bifidobacterium felsineum]MBT1164348.1 HAD family phosphatase [Bifidobacterium felsineum]PJM76607.1 haloacid dehalogenase [Bifidobacterium felsineum]
MNHGVDIFRKSKAVLWDLDGTLIDSDPYWVTAERTLLESYGGTWDDALAKAMQGASLPVLIRLLHERGVALPADEIVQRLTDEVMRMESEHLPWVEGARELLTWLAAERIPSILVTGSPRVIADNVLGQAPAGAFVGAISGNDYLPPKPSPEPYLHAARMAGADPHDCVIFEDSLPGLTAARASGAYVVAVTGHARVDMTGCGLYDCAIRDYREWNPAANDSQ